MKKCIILVPTHRWDDSTVKTLCHYASFANEELGVIISDNSTNAEKHAFLDRLKSLFPQVHINKNNVNIGAAKNWVVLYEQCGECEYIIYLADDDFVTIDYINDSVNFLENNSDYVACSGRFVVKSGLNSFYVCNNVTSGESFIERVSSYTSDLNNPGSICYSVMRKIYFGNYLNYIKLNPFEAIFFDYYVAPTLLLHGKFMSLDMGVYLWDSGNWFQYDSFRSSITSKYKEFGLPDFFADYFYLHMAADSIIYAHSKFFQFNEQSLSTQLSVVLAETRLTWFKNLSRDRIEGHMSLLGDTCYNKLEAFMLNPCNDIQEVVSIFLEILGSISPDLHRLYRKFIRENTTLCIE